MTTEVRSFALMLNQLEDGDVIRDLTEQMRELNGKLAEVADATGSASGEISLKIRFTAERGGAMYLDADIGRKDPKVKRRSTTLWLTKDKTLTAENPKQQRLPLREVPPPATDVRDLPSETAHRDV